MAILVIHTNRTGSYKIPATLLSPKCKQYFPGVRAIASGLAKRMAEPPVTSDPVNMEGGSWIGVAIPVLYAATQRLVWEWYFLAEIDVAKLDDATREDIRQRLIQRVAGNAGTMIEQRIPWYEAKEPERRDQFQDSGLVVREEVDAWQRLFPSYPEPAVSILKQKVTGDGGYSWKWIGIGIGIGLALHFVKNFAMGPFLILASFISFLPFLLIRLFWAMGLLMPRVAQWTGNPRSVTVLMALSYLWVQLFSYSNTVTGLASGMAGALVVFVTGHLMGMILSGSMESRISSFLKNGAAHLLCIFGFLFAMGVGSGIGFLATQQGGFVPGAKVAGARLDFPEPSTEAWLDRATDLWPVMVLMNDITMKEKASNTRMGCAVIVQEPGSDQLFAVTAQDAVVPRRSGIPMYLSRKNLSGELKEWGLHRFDAAQNRIAFKQLVSGDYGGSKMFIFQMTHPGGTIPSQPVLVSPTIPKEGESVMMLVPLSELQQLSQRVVRAKVSKVFYDGASMIIDLTEAYNAQEIKGAPVLNKNGHLVGIVTGEVPLGFSGYEDKTKKVLVEGVSVFWPVIASKLPASPAPKMPAPAAVSPAATPVVTHMPLAPVEMTTRAQIYEAHARLVEEQKVLADRQKALDKTNAADVAKYQKDVEDYGRRLEGFNAAKERVWKATAPTP